ncbi:MAG: aryl-sulfate sulfotransferase [Planctomycetes bacterium]|nr:aryl-sulfate sulfotransferase [Planctomycetota bacterium]
MPPIRLRSALASLACLALAACDRGPANADRTAPRFVAAPTFAPSADPSAPLGGTIVAETDEPTRLELTVVERDSDERRTHVIARELATKHSALALHFAAGLKHTLSVTAIDAAGNRTRAEQELTFDAPPVSEKFPPLKLTVSDLERMEPGITLLNARGSGPPAVPPSDAFLIMVDERGRVIWYFQSSRDIVSARRLRNGNLLYVCGRKTAVEIDMLGRTVQTWFASRLGVEDKPEGATLVDLDTLHHEIYELPSGFGADFVALSTELREVDGWPGEEWRQGARERTAKVAGDIVVEFNRDGTVVRRFPLLDLLDPRRVDHDSLEDFWSATYTPKDGPKGASGELLLLDTEDWAHANAVLIDRRDSNYVVSCRNQDVLLKLDRATGKVRWLCGSPVGWREPWNDLVLTPKGRPFEWNYHQHTPRFTRDGNLIVFDNGNGRAIPPFVELRDPVRYSRAVEFKIDEQARTVEQVWSYGSSSQPWYSFFLGGVEPLPKTGNVLVTDGGKQISPTIRQGFARVFEVTHTAAPEIVFELVIRDDAPFDALSWSVYRSERLPSVYPPE